MRVLRRSLVGLLAGLTMLAVGALPARADATLDEIAATVGVNPEPTDFVIIVDTSLSMQEHGRWSAARDAVSGLVENLTPDDYATIITFDDGAKVVYAGQDPSPQTVLDRLPATPTGTQTDIGAAIEAGVEALDRSGAADVAAIALLTDGELDAADSSAYATADAPAWETLRGQADSVVDGRQVGAFAIALGPQSDAGLLTKVFPDAVVGTPDDVVAFLSGLNDALTAVRVRDAIRPDVESPATLTLEDVSDPDGGTMTATAHFTSTAAYLPLTLESMALDPAIEGAVVTVDPSSLDLEPGKEASADVTVQFPAGTDTSAALVATLSTPWQEQLDQLGLDQALTAASDPVEIAVAADAPPPDSAAPSDSGTPAMPADTTVSDLLAELPPWAIPAALGALVVVVVAWILAAAARKRRPRVDGSLALLRDGTTLDEFVVAGPEAKVTRGQLRVVATRRKDGAVSLKGHQGKAKFSANLRDGGTTTLPDGATLRYTEQRTRMIDMVTDRHGLNPAEEQSPNTDQTPAVGKPE